MSDYDQERISALHDELEEAKDKIKSLEVEIQDLKAQLEEVAELGRDLDLQQ